MFAESWLALIFLLFLFSILLGHSGLLVITLLVTAAASLAWFWNYFVLRRVEYARELRDSRAFAGERVTVSVTLTNRKMLPVPWLRVDDAFPDSLALFRAGSADPVARLLEPTDVPGRGYLRHLVTLGPRERIRWTYHIDCARRGFYFFGPAQVQSGDILGIFAQSQQFNMPGCLIVYPRVRPLPELGFPGKEPFGEQRTRRHLIQDPSRVVGVREYHPSDSIKRVHWKASARQGELQVKVYEPTISQQLVIFLNVASFAQTWLGIVPEYQEQAISVAASIAYHATERRFAVGLVANGSVPHSDQSIKVPPNRAPDQLPRVLEALAAVTEFATARIEKLLVAQSPQLSLGATLVVVTTVVTEELLAEMLRLRDAGRRMVLVSMDPKFKVDGPAGLTTFHLPLAEADFTGMWTQAMADEVPVSWAGRRGGERG